jgi:hypothetical protein
VTLDYTHAWSQLKPVPSHGRWPASQARRRRHAMNITYELRRALQINSCATSASDRRATCPASSRRSRSSLFTSIPAGRLLSEPSPGGRGQGEIGGTSPCTTRNYPRTEHPDVEPGPGAGRHASRRQCEEGAGASGAALSIGRQVARRYSASARWSLSGGRNPKARSHRGILPCPSRRSG